MLNKKNLLNKLKLKTDYSEKIMSGISLSKKIKSQIKLEYNKKLQKPPGLGIIQIGDRKDSNLFIKNKIKWCKDIGFNSHLKKIPESENLEKIKSEIQKMNKNKKIHGIVLQLPLPEKHKSSFEELINLITPKKDIDCLTRVNYTNMLFFNSPNNPKTKKMNFPCISLAIKKLLDQHSIKIKGKKIVIIGNSYLVGFPISVFFQRMDGTVTICHENTDNLKEFTKKADIVVSATGIRDLIGSDFLKQGCVLMDVGICFDEDFRIVGGDCVFDEGVLKRVGFVTPVPGGLGPLTVGFMIENLWRCYQNIEGF